MKICIISQLYPPYIKGGGEIYVDNLAKALLNRGHEVSIVTCKPFNGLKSLSASVDVKNTYKFFPLNAYFAYESNKVSFFLKPLFYMVNLWNIHPYLILKKILKKEQPDVIHIHAMDSFSYSIFDAIRSLEIPSVLTLHAYTFLCPRGGLLNSSGKICKNPHMICNIYKSITKILLGSKPDIVISPSKFLIDIFTNNGYFLESKKYVIPHGIYCKYGEVQSNIKGKANFNILYVGAIQKWKGLHVLIKAFQNLSLSDAILHIVGKGDTNYESKMKELASKNDNIVFYGEVLNKDIHKFFRMADIFVIPSVWYEPFGIVIQESFCNGTPVIGSSIGGIKELIEDGVNGYLYSAGNISQLSAIIERLYHNKEELEILSLNALNTSNKYRMSSHIQKLEEIYSEAIEKRNVSMI